MIKKFLFPLLILFSCGTTLSYSPALALEIENFRFGLVCTDNESFSWLCFETEEIFVTGQGRCTWVGTEYPCTWYGYEFDYTGAEPGDLVTCVVTSNFPATTGNPREVVAENVTTSQYEFGLDVGDGSFYNPQYTLFQVSPVKSYYEETVCSLADTELYRFRMTTYMPTSVPETQE
ncbi:MAG: hypothetical protein AAFU53_13570 [Cyanobacteria bacterium J06632_3]